MKSLGDVRKVFDSVGFAMSIFGATPEWFAEWNRRVEELGQAFCAERELEWGSMETLAHVSDEDELGQESEKIFQELLAWLRPAHRSFASL